VITNVNRSTFYNGSLEEFSSIALSDGKVVDVYSDTSFETSSNTKAIDGKGRTMLPGLVDAHAHVMGLGCKQMNADVTGKESVEATLQMVESYAAQYPAIEWMEGRKWDQTDRDIGRFPTAEEVEGAVKERPVWLMRVDGHAGWANSKAMELAGITAETEDPEGGKIIRDEEGKPTGVFIDGATDLISSKISDPSNKEQMMAFRKALQQMRSHGLTGVHDAGIGAAYWQLYKHFADNDSLTTRIYAMIKGTGTTFDSLAQKGPVKSYDHDMLALRSVKLWADGALG